jgi:hypothetical protein
VVRWLKMIGIMRSGCATALAMTARLLLGCAPDGGLLAQDAHEIVRRSVELDKKYVHLVMQYTFIERQVQTQLAGDGKVKSRDVKSWDVTPLEGSPYRRLIARNDQPLPGEEEKTEQLKLQHNIDTRKNETPEQREARMAEARKRNERQRETIREIPDAFNFRILREDRYEGKDVWVIEALPKKGYKPKTRAASFFPKVRGTLWISKDDYQWVKAEGESTDTITFGAIIVRVAKGATIRIEQTRVNNEVWLPKRIDVAATARIALVKMWRGRLETDYSKYRKFHVESRLVQ